MQLVVKAAEAAPSKHICCDQFDVRRAMALVHRNAQTQHNRAGEPQELFPEGNDPATEQKRHPDVDRQNEGIEDTALLRMILLDMGGLLPQVDGFAHRGLHIQ